MKIRKLKQFHLNDNASYSLLETLISMGIVIGLISLFFVSFNNVYNVYERSDIDLQAKTNSFMEKLLSSSEESSDSSQIDGILNLGTSPTVAYGIVYRNPATGEVTVIGDQYYFSDEEIGPVDRCFLAGTPILMADGSHKNIEDIKPGDRVQSYDVENKELKSGEVTQLFYYPSEDMIYNCYLVINGALKVTPNHRFYSDEKWVYADELKVGDNLFNPYFNYEIVSIEKIYETPSAYDFEVQPYHTYFVSIEEKIDVLVHNPTQQNTGYKNPAACGGTKNEWTTPANAYTTNNVYATTSTLTTNDEEIYYNFNFGIIPAGSTINGIDVSVEAAKPTALPVPLDFTISAALSWNVGTSWTNPPKSQTWTTGTDTYKSYGAGSAETWGRTWSTTELSNSNFRVLFKLTAGTASVNYKVDHVRINVYYTPPNSPPAAPSEPSPVNRSTDQSVNTDLSWSCTDPDLDPLTYDIYFGTTSPPSLRYSGNTTSTYDPGTLGYSTKYYWKIVAKDSLSSTPGPIWEFTTVPLGNSPPAAPSEPSPVNRSTDQSVNTDLSWSCTDPDLDPLTYDIYFGTTSPPSLCYSGNTTKTYDPGTLSYSTPYYWKIVAKDNHDHQTTGPIWEFTTTSTQTYSLRVAIEPIYNAGTVNPSYGKYNPDTQVTLNATANTDWNFDHWVCWDDPINGSTNSQVTITMTSNKYVYAYFESTKQINNIYADFTWFDIDGLGQGQNIYFDASASSADYGIKQYEWDFNEDGKFEGPSSRFVEWDFGDNEPHEVLLKIIDNNNPIPDSAICVYSVQANKIIIPETDPSKEKGDIELTNQNNMETFNQENTNYYTNYTAITGSDNYYLYEIKNKNKVDYQILDYNKIKIFKEELNQKYSLIKSSPGLDTIYNFNITIKDDTGSTICSCGATPSDSSPQKTVVRKVLIYYPAETEVNEGGETPGILNHPTYREGEISVSFFIGGTPPQ